MGSSAWSAFDLTRLAKAWKTGAQNANCGILLKLADESVYRTFYSCEYSTVDYRPYMVLEYTEELSLNYSTMDITEGSSFTLTATTQLGTPEDISWTSSDENIATVSENGVVTGLKAGKVTITATYTYADGSSISKGCTVYVTLADGVYYFQNFYSRKYLGVEDAGITGLVNVEQQSKVASGGTEWLCQLWKVTYLGIGLYTIRPMHKLDKALDATNNNADIYTIGTTDSLTDHPYAQWYIEWNSQGYVLRNYEQDDCALRPENGSTVAGANVTVDTYSPALTSFKWVVQKLDDPPSGVILYDTGTQSAVSNPTRFVELNETKTLNELQLSAAAYSAESIDQSFYWFSSNNSVATVDNNTGEVTGVAVGNAVIYGRKTINGIHIYVSFSLQVRDKYTHQLVTDFGFTFDDAMLIESVYARVCAAHPNDSSMLWAWRTARVLGGIVYQKDFKGTIEWCDVAGIAYLGSEEDYFTETLGFSAEEYAHICDIISRNYSDDSTADFAHMQISLSARLAYHLHKTGVISNIYTQSSDETVSYLAGWLGDATLTGESGNTTSFDNDDYHADLDAENVYRLILSGTSYIDAFNNYYEALLSQTRATCFLMHIDYNTIQSMVYYELIDKELYELLALAEANGNTTLYTIYLNQLLSEQYHIDTIRNNFPDTYNFLHSIQDGKADIDDYL